MFPGKLGSVHSEKTAFNAIMNDPAARAEYALLSQISDMYYNRGMKLSEVAQALRFSNAKVSRLLSAARERGIVEIRVHRILDRITELETLLKERYRLDDAVVVSTYPDLPYEEELDAVTDFAAAYISERLVGNITLGVSNGESVNRVAKKIKPVHDCNLDIVQLMGSGGGAHTDIESRDLVTRIAGIFPGGRSFFLNTPLYIESSRARDELLREEAVAKTFARMNDCDILLTGIGSFGERTKEAPIIIREYLTRAHAEELAGAHAAGCICAQFYDADGKTVSCRWNSNCVSMSLSDVKQNNMTVAVCCGERKVSSIRGALNGRLINVLVTSAHVASKVLQEE